MRLPCTTTVPLATGKLLARIWTSSSSVLVDGHIGRAQHDRYVERNVRNVGHSTPCRGKKLRWLNVNMVW
jgi:hypothetical protein